MTSRRIAFVLVLAAVLLCLQPASVEALRYKPIYPLRGGQLVEDSTCPAATHVLRDLCSNAPRTYLVFNRVKGLKRFIGQDVIVNGPIETTSCSLPLLDVRKIGFAPSLPPPCPAP